MRRAEVDAQLLAAIRRPSCSSVLLSGSSGVGKSHACAAAFEAAGMEVVCWDPVATGMRVPAMVGTTATRVVLYVDDVDVAIRGGPKGASSAMLAAVAAVKQVGPMSKLLVMTCGEVAGDRTLAAMGRTVDVHLCLAPSRSEVVRILSRCGSPSASDALASRYGTDVRAALIAAHNGAEEEGGGDNDSDDGAPDVPRRPQPPSATSASLLREAEAVLMEAAGTGGDAACSDSLVWIAEEYRKNFSRCV
jgi:hypothetical protein